MIRTWLTAALVLSIPGSVWADKAKDAAKAAKDVQIKAMKAQIEQLKQQEKAQLKQIDDQYKGMASNVGKQEHAERRDRAWLEREEREAMKHIDEHYHWMMEHMQPKQVHQQLQQALQTLRGMKTTLEQGNWDYGGNRQAARRSIGAADHQLARALEHDTWEERARAGHDIGAAHADLGKALAYVEQKYPNNKGMSAGQVAATQQLTAAMPTLEQTHHLLTAVDHEIKDFEHEKQALWQKREAEKKQKHEEFQAKIRELGKEIHSQKDEVRDLQRKKDAARKQVKEQFAAQIKQIEAAIKQLK
jgi:hypothetical protein